MIKMRRFKQMLPEDEAKTILTEMTNGVLALKDDSDYPYAVPMSYVYDGDAIYLHSAVAGHKIDCLRYNPKVSFCVVKQDHIVPEEFTTYYKSVIVFGTAEFLTDKAEMAAALRLLSGKYSPGIDCEAEIAKSIDHVAVIKINIESLTGKEAIELTLARNRDGNG